MVECHKIRIRVESGNAVQFWGAYEVSTATLPKRARPGRGMESADVAKFPHNVL